MILGEKIERKVYVNQQNFVSDIQLLFKHSFLLSFLHDMLMSITRCVILSRDQRNFVIIFTYFTYSQRKRCNTFSCLAMFKHTYHEEKTTHNGFKY